MMRHFQNWAGQYHCKPQVIKQAHTIEEVQHAINDARSRKSTLRVFGSGYSPSDIAMSDAHLLTLSGLNRIRFLNRETRQVEVEAGITLRDLDVALHKQGMALPYHASVSGQSLAGAMATATHGTGLNFSVMPTWVQALELITADAQLRRLTAEDKELFAATRCSLGALGIHTAFLLNVCDTFELYVEERRIECDVVLRNLQSLAASADHYRLWYLPHAHVFWEWKAWRRPPGHLTRPKLSWPERAAAWLSNKLISYYGFELLLWFSTFSPSALPRINRWYATRYHQTPKKSIGTGLDQFTFDCKFKQYHNEWSIPLSSAQEGVNQLIEQVVSTKFPVHLPIEIRFMGADDIWLSPNQGRDGCHIGTVSYISYGRATPHQHFFEQYELLMQTLNGRPHWGKKFQLSSEQLRDIYPYWDNFQRVRQQLDPEALFSNAYTRRVFGEF